LSPFGRGGQARAPLSHRCPARLLAKRPQTNANHKGGSACIPRTQRAGHMLGSGRWALGADGSAEIDEMDASTLRNRAQELKAGDQWVKRKFSTRKRGSRKKRARCTEASSKPAAASTAQLQHAARALPNFQRVSGQKKSTHRIVPASLPNFHRVSSTPGLPQPLSRS